MKVMYRVPAPYNGGMIEVYGDPENAWYEWRILAGEPCRLLFGRLGPDSQIKHGLHHAADIAADDPGRGPSARSQGGEGGGRRIGDRQNPVGDVEGEGAHGTVMAWTA